MIFDDISLARRCRPGAIHPINLRPSAGRWGKSRSHFRTFERFAPSGSSIGSVPYQKNPTMTDTRWQTDVHGMLRGVRYHDGVLESLEFVAGDQVTLKIRATSAELLTVKAIGLTDVFVELWAGNIILDIFIWRLDEVPPLVGRRHKKAILLGRVEQPCRRSRLGGMDRIPNRRGAWC
jgi:hypothetical protein